LTYRPERMAIHWLDELGAAHVPSASQGRVARVYRRRWCSRTRQHRRGPRRQGTHAAPAGLGIVVRAARTRAVGCRGQTRRRKSPSSTPNRSSGTGRWRRCPTCWSTSTAARPRASGASRNLGDRRQVDRLGPDHRRGPAGAQRLLSRCFP
jgi:hypothetical protein